MLFLEWKFENPSEIIEIRKIHVSKELLSKNENEIVLAGREAPFPIYQIKSSGNDKKGPYFELEFSRFLNVHSAFIKVLFSGHRSLVLPDDFEKKISECADCKSDGSLIMLISAEMNNKVSLRYIDTSNQINRTVLFSTDDWNHLLQRSDALIKEVNLIIRNRRLKEFHNIRKEADIFFRRFLGEEFINLLSRGRRLEYFNDGITEILPVDLLSSRPRCRFLYPDSSDVTAKEREITLRFTQIYDRGLPYALKETKRLSKYFKEPSVRSRYDIELFSLDNHHDNYPRLHETDIFHFSGHGQAQNSETLLSVGGDWRPVRQVNFITDIQNCRVAVLHACESARLMDTAQAIHSEVMIGTPYQISDEESIDFRAFYSFYHPAYPYESYLVSSLVEPSIADLTRYFEAYHR